MLYCILTYCMCTRLHCIIIPYYITRLYGITLYPETKNYVMVLNYADEGSLRNYLDTNYDKLSWYTNLRDLWYIANGLKHIHEKELIHRDLHIGNILSFSDTYSNVNRIRINDMGLCKPANYDKLENVNINTVYIWCF